MDDVDQKGCGEEPDKICVIVHSGKNLQSKKKGRCKFSVIFGVGSKKFRTDVVEDIFGSPVWNTEAEIDVDDASQPLILTATEKDDILGQVVVPLNELPTTKPHQGKRVALQPHKKCSDPQGEVVLSAWITAFRTPRVGKSSPSGALKSLKKMKSKISHSPLLRRKSKSGDLMSQGMRGSLSVGDLAGFGHKKSNLLSVPSESLCSVTSTDSDASSQCTTASLNVSDDLRRPEVSGISPKEGPVTGGTRLTVRGVNLGRDIDDILSLSICGADCTPTVEYESTSKLYVTTIPWRSGSGDIIIKTASGGCGSSLVQFTFVGDGDQVSPLPLKRMSPLVTRRMSPRQDHRKRHSFDTSLLSTSSTAISMIKEDEKPEVSGISPKEGSAEGGTRLTVRGQNLGRNRQDVLAVMVCGQDCTDTLEYESSHKLVVTTKSWKPCTGQIIVETTSGGRGSSTVKFTYLKPSPAPVSPVTVRKVVEPAAKLREMTNFGSEENLLAPEVTGISPTEGPTDGGTKLTIRGMNLGVDETDVIGLTVCGADCLSTLKYESPGKLHCTTSPWKAGSGKILVETRQGGIGSSLVSFTYVKPVEDQTVPVVKINETVCPTPPPSKPPRRSIGQKDTKVTGADNDEADGQQEVQSQLSNQPSVPESALSQDESMVHFGGATPYPDAHSTPTGAVPYPEEACPVPTGHTDSASPISHAQPTHRVSHGLESSKQHSPSQNTPVLQPVSQEKRERRSLPASPGGDNVIDQVSQVHHDKQLIVNNDDSQKTELNVHDDTKNTDELGKKEIRFLSTVARQEKQNNYITEQQQEREVQSGPTRQELMEEIRRVKLENRQLHEQNHMMKQYLERLLSDVMIHCPELLCIDSVSRHDFCLDFWRFAENVSTNQ